MTSSRHGRVPDFIIIGTMKAGTTSLHYYLDQHPSIAMPREKELNFFTHNWSLGTTWYLSQFDAGTELCGECSPSYTTYPRHPDSSENMVSIAPDARLIYVVRDPLERIKSHHVHWYSMGYALTFDDELAKMERSRYVQVSCYFMQLSRYLRYYPLSRILVINQEDLLNRRRETLHRVFRFLGVDDTFISRRFQHSWHLTRDKRRKNVVGRQITRAIAATRIKMVAPNFAWHMDHWLCLPFSSPVAKPYIDPIRHGEVLAYLRDDADKFSALTGMSFAQWSIYEP